jgi:hypothetical protein
VRLEALRRLLGYADVLDSVQASLRNKVEEENLTKIDVLATALLNRKAAKQFVLRDPASRQEEMAALVNVRLDAPGETKRIAPG